jgi:hypothetical protein
MFEITKGLPEPEDFAAAKWPENNAERVEFLPTTVMMKGPHGQAESRPAGPFRPVQDDRSWRQTGKNVSPNVGLPNRAIGVNEENPAATWNPSDKQRSMKRHQVDYHQDDYHEDKRRAQHTKYEPHQISPPSLSLSFRRLVLWHDFNTNESPSASLRMRQHDVELVISFLYVDLYFIIG